MSTWRRSRRSWGEGRRRRRLSGQFRLLRPGGSTARSRGACAAGRPWRPRLIAEAEHVPDDPLIEFDAHSGPTAQLEGVRQKLARAEVAPDCVGCIELPSLQFAHIQGCERLQHPLVAGAAALLRPVRVIDVQQHPEGGVETSWRAQPRAGTESADRALRRSGCATPWTPSARTIVRVAAIRCELYRTSRVTMERAGLLPDRRMVSPGLRDQVRIGVRDDAAVNRLLMLPQRRELRLFMDPPCSPSNLPSEPRIWRSCGPTLPTSLSRATGIRAATWAPSLCPELTTLKGCGELARRGPGLHRSLEPGRICDGTIHDLAVHCSPPTIKRLPPHGRAIGTMHRIAAVPTRTAPTNANASVSR